MSRTTTLIRPLRGVIPAGLITLAACGGGDDAVVDDAGGVTSDVDPTPSSAPVPEPSSDTAAPSDASNPSDAPPEADSGTITIAGVTTEVGAEDFGICETVNPAFAEDFNIVTETDDGTSFVLNGTLGDMDPELDGLFLGEIPDQEQAVDLELARDGRTLSGTAVASVGEIEFSFTC